MEMLRRVSSALDGQLVLRKLSLPLHLHRHREDSAASKERRRRKVGPSLLTAD